MSQVFDYLLLTPELTDLRGAANWYVGFSGGVDSTVLLHLMHRWVQENPGVPPLTALHINHALQDAASDWERRCATVCEQLQIPFTAVRVAVERGGGGPESAARSARYRVFEDRLGAGDVLFLAHHRDDQVETFFLRLMRGAGVRGLAAIPRRRVLGLGRVVRPLLELPRSALEDYARRHQLPRIEDPSNRDNRLDRNFLRNEVLPLLASRWPGYRQTVSRASQHMASAAQALEQSTPAPDTRYSTIGDPGIDAGLLRRSGAATILRDWLRSGGYPMPGQVPLAEFLRQLRDAGDSGAPRLQTGLYTLQLYRDTVYLLPSEAVELPDSVTLSPGAKLELPGVGRIELEPSANEGLWFAPHETPVVRWRSGGESLRPVCRHNSTSLKKLLQEEGVPPWWRDRLPLLYLGEELLAVGDRWPCYSSRYGGGRAGQCCYRFTWSATTRGGFD